MRTLGVDLAAGPERTAACLVTWEAGRALARLCPDPADDDTLVALIGGLDWERDRVGIDAPFGWPDGFVGALVAHRDGAPWPGRGFDEPAAHRRQLRYRLTDLEVARRLRRYPMSVSSDRIAVCAMRCAGLLDRLSQLRPGAVDRAGAGLVVETYPAAALALWGLPARGYKGPANRTRLGAVLDGLREAVPGLEIAPPDAPRLAASDHCLDALVCALVARSVALGRSVGPTAEQLAPARREGWIHLPVGHPGGLTDAGP